MQLSGVYICVPNPVRVWQAGAGQQHPFCNQFKTSKPWHNHLKLQAAKN